MAFRPASDPHLRQSTRLELEALQLSYGVQDVRASGSRAAERGKCRMKERPLGKWVGFINLGVSPMGAGSLPLKLGGLCKGTENCRQEWGEGGQGEGCLGGVFSSKTARHCWAVWKRAAFTSVFVKHSASACQLVNLGSPPEGPHIRTMPFYSVWLGGRVVSPASSVEIF